MMGYVIPKAGRLVTWLVVPANMLPEAPPSCQVKTLAG